MKTWKTWQREETQTKILFFAAIGVLIAVLVPLFWIAHYNFFSADDFIFVKNAETVWEESHSVIRVLSAQASYVKSLYSSWQGTFFSSWFYTSMVGIFGKNAYYVGTYLSLGGFVLSETILFLIIFRKILQTDIFSAGIVTASCLSLQILMMPVPSEAFFWFCGAVVYTFIHALALLLTAVLIALYYSDKLWKTVSLEISAVLLTIAVGGSNYVTGLTMLIIYGLSTLWVIYKKHPRRWMYLGNTVLYIAAFLVNMMAPGNQFRQSVSEVEHLSAVTAVFLSVQEAAAYVVTSIYPPCIILGLMFLPLFIKMVKKSKCRYSLPILVSVLSFGVFAAQFTPTIYALGILGAGRILNLYRLNFYVLLFGNELYWTGWFVRRIEERYEVVEKVREKQHISLLLPGWCLGGLALCYALIFYGGVTLTSVSALMSLRHGEAQQYYQEYQERLEILEDNTAQEVYLKSFTLKPYVLFFDDIEADKENWKNAAMAKYFGKTAVYLIE